MSTDTGAELQTLILKSAKTIFEAKRKLLKSTGLHPGQDMAILILAEQGPLRMSTFAAAIGCRPPTATKTVNRLKRRGYVAVSQNEADHREQVAALTDHGRNIARLVEAATSLVEAAVIDTVAVAVPLPQMKAALNAICTGLKQPAQMEKAA